MPRTRKHHTKNFTTIGNDLIQNISLSWKARGLIIYLLSMPDNWDFNLADLASRAPDGRAALRSGVEELKTHGYIQIVKERGENGKFDGWTWHVYEEPPKCENRTSAAPKVEKPISDNPKSEKPNSENRPLEKKQGTKETETKETEYKKNHGASAPASPPPPSMETSEDPIPEELFPDRNSDPKSNGQSEQGKTSILDDPRASDPLGLSQACAERQQEVAAKGLDPGWTVADGADPVAGAMVEAWIIAKDVDPGTIPKKLLKQYQHAMQAVVKGFGASSDQAARAVRHVLTHSDYAWYKYSHPAIAKFARDVQDVLTMILSGIDPSASAADRMSLEERAQGTGYDAIMAYRELEERRMREAGEEIPKGLFDH